MLAPWFYLLISATGGTGGMRKAPKRGRKTKWILPSYMYCRIRPAGRCGKAPVACSRSVFAGKLRRDTLGAAPQKTGGKMAPMARRQGVSLYSGYATPLTTPPAGPYRRPFASREHDTRRNGGPRHSPSKHTTLSLELERKQLKQRGPGRIGVKPVSLRPHHQLAPVFGAVRLVDAP